MNSIPTLSTTTPTIDVYIKLAQFPILADRIRVRMREELFRRGVISRTEFENEVKILAIESQRREGLNDPVSQEEESVWQRRLEQIRDFHTDAYFANNLGSALLEQLIQDILNAQPVPSRPGELTFNPEIAPWELLFRQGELYEALPLPEQVKIQHHLQELKVVLIKRMISDQLPFIGVARKVFDMKDLRWVYQRLIGSGRIGGKAGGMLLSWKILQQRASEYGPDISKQVGIPETFFIGSEVFYEFMLVNRLDKYINQKYLPLEQMQIEYPRIVNGFMAGEFPDDILQQLQGVLGHMAGRPFIVRSSSLLEDNWSQTFAEKYYSHFCPNQGSPEENLQQLLDAVRQVLASTFNPQAIVARQQSGLIDYDERMAVMIQEACGNQYRDYFFPAISGLGLSRNPLLWNEQIRPEDGMLRLVWGFSKRVSDPLDGQHACMVALSQPQMREPADLDTLRHTSQKFIKMVDMRKNDFVFLPVQAVLPLYAHHLQHVASIDRGDFLQDIETDTFFTPVDPFIVTFHTLTKDSRFVKLMRTALSRLEEGYGRPMEVEFALNIVPHHTQVEYKLYILECRPATAGQPVE